MLDISALKWMQGIVGHGYYGNCVVPIIENTARECELTGALLLSSQKSDPPPDAST